MSRLFSAKGATRKWGDAGAPTVGVNSAERMKLRPLAAYQMRENIRKSLSKRCDLGRLNER
jgi:hypothetical protein